MIDPNVRTLLGDDQSRTFADPGRRNASVVLLAHDCCEHLAKLVEGALPEVGLSYDLEALLAGDASDVVAVICTEQLLTPEVLARVGEWIGQQPAWSDLAFVIFEERGSDARRAGLLRALGNVVFPGPDYMTSLGQTLWGLEYSRCRQWRLRGAVESGLAGMRA